MAPALPDDWRHAVAGLEFGSQGLLDLVESLCDGVYAGILTWEELDRCLAVKVAEFDQEPPLDCLVRLRQP